MNEQEFAEMAAGYALNALSPEEATAFERARRAHPEWEQDVVTDAAATARLADLVEPVTPSADIRAALLARIAATPQTPTAAAPQASPRRRFGTRSWFALAASLVLLVGVGWGAVFVSDQLTTPASVVALQQIKDAPDAQSASVELTDGGEATAYWSTSLGTSVLVSDGLPTLAENQSFELWYVRDGAPISAGTFSAEDGAVTALLAGDVEPGDVIAVTVEADGGSPTGQPTTDPILAIPTA